MTVLCCAYKIRRDSLFCEVYDAQLNQMTNVHSSNLGRGVKFYIIPPLLSEIPKRTISPSVLNSNRRQHIPIFSCSEEYLFHCHSVLNILWQTGGARARGRVCGGVGRRVFTAGGGRRRSGEGKESHNRLVAVPATISITQAASLMEHDPPGGAHENSIFSRRAKVDVLLQHQRCTSSCMSAGLNIKMNYESFVCMAAV